jgi:hypothetical protein
MTKPKSLTLRPDEIPRLLRPSGLVVIPCKEQPQIISTVEDDWAFFVSYTTTKTN